MIYVEYITKGQDRILSCNLKKRISKKVFEILLNISKVLLVSGQALKY